MVKIEDFGERETAWCPGCGNFSIRESVKKALVELGLAPFQVMFVSGIGQAAKSPHYINCNMFSGLHGRAMATATGFKLANPELETIVESGDGCSYGEGGNHFLAAVRRNIGLTCLVHDNQIYGLTKGQASPTTQMGVKTKAQPFGVFNEAFNPVATAVGLKAGFVARGFAGEKDHLTDLIVQGVKHRGFALIDILHPCVSFNKINTWAWYKERCRKLPDDYDPADWKSALDTARQWGDEIPIGVIYKDESRPPLEDRMPGLQKGPLVGAEVPFETLEKIMTGYE